MMENIKLSLDSEEYLEKPSSNQARDINNRIGKSAVDLEVDVDGLEKLVDGTHRTPKYTLSGVPFISVTNMSSGKLDLSNTKFISEEEHQELWKRCNPERNDILLSKVGTTGVPAIVDTDIQFSLFVSVALLKFNKQLLDIDFLVYAILTPDFQRQCQEHTRGVGNKNWVIVDIANTMLPLPPLAEQKRIVAKLEEILPLCERLK